MRLVNHAKTAFLLGALLGLCMLVGHLVGGAAGMLIGLILGGVGNLVAFFFSDRIALAAMQARPIAPDESPWLHGMVRDLADRAGLPMPRVYLCPHDAPNAFATGRNPRHSAVAITEGMLRAFPRQEIAGVVAHELAHIKHRDVLITTVAAILGGVISYAGYALIFSGGNQDEKEGGGSNLLGALAAMILAPVAAMLIQLAISRSREYAADSYAAELCADPRGMAAALHRLGSLNQRIPTEVNPAYNGMFIIQPLSATARLSSLFSTHPPVEKRIAALLQMAPHCQAATRSPV